MNELVRDELIRIVRENSEDVLLDPVRTKAFLNDFCGNKYRREINSITLALKEGAATELLNSRRNRTERFAIARLSKNLEESFGFPRQQTIWTVESIAIALGIIESDSIKTAVKDTEKESEGRHSSVETASSTQTNTVVDERKEAQIDESSYARSDNTAKTKPDREMLTPKVVDESKEDQGSETKPEEARSPQFIQDEEKVSGPTIKVKKKRIALPLLGMLSLLLIILFIIISGNSQNKPPNKPSNPSPTNHATNQPLTITLSWDCSDPDGDAVTYDVYFGTNSNPTTREATTQSGKSINRSNLLIGTTYYWKVVAKDSKGATTEGPVWRFTTQSNRAPNAPSNPSPTNHATNQPLTVTLSWDCSDPDGDAVTYDVYFGTNSNPTTREATNRSGRTLNRSNLSYGTTYYWKVVAKDSKGATTEGPEWRFTTQSAPTASSYTPSSIVPSMVLVEKGSFTMGDEFGDLWDSSRPTHKVTLTYDFYIGKYEVTFDEYDAFCNATGRSKAHDRGWGRGSRPVINVSWWDAIAYCNWLSEKEKLPKAYDNNGNLLDKDGRVTTDPSKVVGYRFPTEAEWEYAARGGNKSKGYKYSGSDNIDEVAWYWDNSGLRTQEVGKKAPNELGIYDMSGNVWEWCSDWYGSYSSSAQTNPYNNSGSDRVFRGGSWGSSATYVRVAFRDGSSPTNSLGNLGFRIARTVP